MLPRWSDKAMKAVSIFFRKWNDIDVYVEDTDLTTLRIYNELLSRLSNDKFNIERVFPLGSKLNVIESCKNYNHGNRLALHVIDGDLDLLCNVKGIHLKGLYIQDRYCIENYLLDKDAFVEIVHDEIATVSREEVDALLNLNDYMNDLCCLLDLFIIFGVMRIFFPSVKNVGLGTKPFISGGKTPFIDIIRINNFVCEMYGHMCEVYGSEKIISELLRIQEQTFIDDALLINVSGKDFLLPAMFIRIRNLAKVRSSNDSIKLRLAKYCDLGSLNSLKHALENCSQNI